MKSRRFVPSVALVGALLLACGGSTDEDASGAGGSVSFGGGATQTGGSQTTQTKVTAGAAGNVVAGSGGVAARGGSGSNPSVAGGAAGSPPLPIECQSSKLGTKTAITFKIVNAGAEPIVFDFCNRIPALYSCADEYAERLEDHPRAFTVPCDNPVGYCGGGGCVSEPVPIPTGESVVFEWPGKIYSYGSSSSPNNCTCYVPHSAPIGLYRATVNVYDATSANEVNFETARELSVDFAYPDDDGVVTFTVP